MVGRRGRLNPGHRALWPEQPGVCVWGAILSYRKVRKEMGLGKKKKNKSSVYNRLNLRCPLNVQVEMAIGSRTQMSEAHG